MENNPHFQRENQSERETKRKEETEEKEENEIEKDRSGVRGCKAREYKKRVIPW